jgi:virulence factor Mce-like protein
MKPGKIARFPIRRPWVVIGIVAAVALAYLIYEGRQQPYHVHAAFVSAVDLTPGLDVRVDGVNVGKVSSVDYSGGEAIVGIGISDPRVYPLHQGTEAIIRYGTTVGNGTRRVDLVPGPSSAPTIPNGGIIPVQDTTTPVEFDQLFDTFNAQTRANTQSFFNDTATQLHGHAPQLSAGIHATPPALAGAAGLLGDLATDTNALQGLIYNANQATTTIAAHQPELQDLLSVAAGTFQTFAQRTQRIQQAIDGFAPTLTSARTTLARLDTSVNILNSLVTTLAPGAIKLQSLANVAAPALAELENVAPLAASTLRVGINEAPRVTSFLAQARPFMQQLSPVLSTSTPMLQCITPYAPELAGWASTWASVGKNADSSSHYARIHVVEGLTAANGALLSSAQALSLTPGLTYAFPRPPGLNAGRPQFIPACGYTEANLNPADDPERTQ